MMSGPALGLSDLLAMGEAVVPERGTRRGKSGSFPPFGAPHRAPMV
jgi:hypothetical protein